MLTMHIVAKKIFNILFIINLFSSILAQSCNLDLSNKEWDKEWRLILTKSSNNQPILLRDRSVSINHPLDMYCNREPRLSRANCKPNGAFDVTLPLATKCNERDSLPSVVLEDRNSHCHYTLYKVGFNVPIGSSTQFFETYRVCFDVDHLRTLYTIHTAYPKAGSRPENAKFSTDGKFSNAQADAFRNKKILPRFQHLLGKNQKYMEKDNTDHHIDRGHLSPSADFAFQVLKMSTFKLINVIPQFKTIDNKNWQELEKWVREYRTPAKICTGVLDCHLKSGDFKCILQLEHDDGHMVPIFLADTHKIPIPLWTYKIISGKDGVPTVFLTYNNIYHKGQPPSRPTDICMEAQENSCPSKVKQTIKNGLTFCCDYNTFINKAVPYLKGIC